MAWDATKKRLGKKICPSHGDESMNLLSLCLRSRQQRLFNSNRQLDEVKTIGCIGVIFTASSITRI